MEVIKIEINGIEIKNVQRIDETKICSSKRLIRLINS
jgi:hypothetical protein